MSVEGKFLKTLGQHFQRRFTDTAPEYAKVISIDPLVIQLDLEPNFQLSYDDGDFTVNDQLVLGVGDRIVVTQMRPNKNRYSVMYRIANPVGVAVFGDPTLAVGVIRVGDVTGPASAGTAHTHDMLVGSEKVVVE